MADKNIRFPNVNLHDEDGEFISIPAIDQGDGTYRLGVQDSAIASAVTSGSAYVLSGTVTLAAGTAAIGKLAANSGVDIGDVDVKSLPAVVLGAGTAEVGKLAAGTALVGIVGIDQSTSNANEVVLKASTAAIGKLAAGTAVIGHVIVDAGTAEIGKLGAGTAKIGEISGSVVISSMPAVTVTAGADYYAQIAEGNVVGHEAWSKIGFSPAMGTTESDVWSKGGTVTFLTLPTKLSVVSSSANDTALGFGARTLTIHYLDAAYTSGSEVVTLNGVTPVAMSGSILRVNAMRLATAGSANATSGSIQLYNNAAGSAVYTYMSPAMTRARNTAYTVPAGKALYLTGLSFGWAHSGEQQEYVRMYLRATQDDNVAKTIFYPFAEMICSNSTSVLDFKVPLKFVEKVDLKVSGVATANGTSNAVLRGWLETP